MLVFHGDRPPKSYLKNREVQGPAPYSTGIIAKQPSKKNSNEAKILERRRREESLYETLKQMNIDNRIRFKSNWVKTTDKRFERNYVKDRLNEALDNEELELNKKRQRLKKLLLHEEDKCLEDAAALHLNEDQRFEKLKQRAEMLKKQREEERMKVVREKRELQFLARCEEIRPIISKKQTVEVFQDRCKQVEMKAVLQKRQLEEEAMYAELWEKDRLAKAAREEREEVMRVERDAEQVRGLNIQMAAKASRSDEALREKLDELKMVDEERKMIKIEDEKAWADKKKMQNKTKTQLDNMIRYKMKKSAIAHQEELALDMKILEKCLEDLRVEELGRKDDRQRLKKETLQYLDYLREQVRLEAQREAELEEMMEEEMKLLWKKRIEEYKREKASRDKLLREVIDVRRDQIQRKMDEIENEKAQKVEDKKMMDKMVAEYEQDKADETRITTMKNYQHASDLLEQMKYERELKYQQEIERQREIEEGLRAEEQYKESMQKVLEGVGINNYNQHPMRRNMRSSNGYKGGYPPIFDVKKI